MRTSLIPHRKVKTSLTKEHINFFHEILCMVENDNASRLKGYDWKKLKTSLNNEIHFENNTQNVRISIPNNIQADSIYICESDSIAAKFLKYLRHAFAHNYITCDREGNLNILLPSKNYRSVKNKASKQEPLKLCCCISFNSLKKVITQLKKQKQVKVKQLSKYSNLNDSKCL